MMLARSSRSQSRPRTRLARSISGGWLPHAGSKWMGAAAALPYAAVGALLLGSVVFLQLKLANIKLASRGAPIQKDQEDPQTDLMQLQHQWDRFGLMDEGSVSSSKAWTGDHVKLLHVGSKKGGKDEEASGEGRDASEEVEQLDEDKVEVDDGGGEMLAKENLEYLEDDEMNFGDGGMQDFEDLKDDDQDAGVGGAAREGRGKEADDQAEELKDDVEIKAAAMDPPGLLRNNQNDSVEMHARNMNSSEKLKGVGQTEIVLKVVTADAKAETEEQQRAMELTVNSTFSDPRSLKTKSRKQSLWESLLGLKNIAPVKANSISDILLPRKYGFNGNSNGLKVLHEEAKELTLEQNSRPGTSLFNKSTSDIAAREEGSFSSDDELIDMDVQRRLEELTGIEDALFLNKETAPPKITYSRTSGKATDASRKDRAGKADVDILNPFNNPLLQDPDTVGSGGLTRNDKAILKALRRSSSEVPSFNMGMRKDNGEKVGARMLQDSFLSKGLHLLQPNEIFMVSPNQLDDTVRHGNSSEESQREVTKYNKPSKIEDSGEQTMRPSRDSSLESSNPMDLMEMQVQKQDDHEDVAYRDRAVEEANSDEEDDPSDEESFRHWGFFPGIDPKSKFSKFMDTFLNPRSCQLNVFMAWTTPPWSFSVRHQRVIESLLHFHPQACVVVFSESVELDFFQGFVEDGFRVAVAMPNLEELLEGTPSEVFASIWLSWRKIDLFYIHYTELLRLAALYKYGGLYLDFDVIILREIRNLHNTVGLEDDGGNWKLNGAVMAFEKTSPFLEACLREYTATYDDKLVTWNGADLLTRVSKTQGDAHSGAWVEAFKELNIVSPASFFPINSSSIHSYFTFPAGEAERRSHLELLDKILQRSSAFHFWNSLTATLVPETGSLVERVLNQFCIKCADLV